MIHKHILQLRQTDRVS